MTDDELKAIEERCEKATEGPWDVEAVSNACRVTIGKGSGKVILARACPPQLQEEETWSNVKFMAAARTDVPALIEEVKRLKAKVSALQEIIEKAQAIADRLGCSDAHGPENPMCDPCLLRAALAKLDGKEAK